ncbi:unnamed protein product [Wuchereria bancrofti]|uniref:Uncharacterized protein n=2 Tax=Wuchereria bancrofti TaxID=6293 RepID=A0A183XDB7_WUCBA|nr:unnamed protein product [Wuchereria bancrofti]
MTTVYLFAGTLLLLVLLVSNVQMDRARRSNKDLEQFASAINGALRLRYGKRSHDSELFSKIILPQEENKLSPLADRVVASLNEAERLRIRKPQEEIISDLAEIKIKCLEWLQIQADLFITIIKLYSDYR